LKKSRTVKSPSLRRQSNPFLQKRDWDLYEGIPNAEVLDISQPEETGTARITLRLSSGEQVTREVGGLQYVVGRRGTLDFLSPGLCTEILSSAAHSLPVDTQVLISGRTLRAKAESSLEVARNVFITGSLTGDSLIRHAVGGCVFAAGRILGAISTTYSPDSTPSRSASTSDSEEPDKSEGSKSTLSEVTNGHADLHLDRRKLVRGVEASRTQSRCWVDSG
jgi:hypothetical protein